MFRWHPIQTVLLVALAGYTGGCSAPESGPAATSPVECDETVGGIPWTGSVAESEPGYDAELAATDLSGLPASIDTTALDDFEVAMVAYALDWDQGDVRPALDREQALADGPMGQAVLAAFARAPGGIDFPFLRRGLHRFYSCDRGFPRELEGFRETVFDFSELPGTLINSMPKSGQRRIYVNGDLGVYVAETMDGDEVRETEILMSLARNDGAIDFIVYGEDGRLMDRSEFSMMGNEFVAASPYACMNCHYDSSTSQFTEIIPQMM